MSRFCPLRGRLWGVFDTPLRPNTCDPSKNCSVFVPYGAVGWAYVIRPYDRVRAILRNIDAIFQPSTYEGSKNGSVYATVGGVCGAYSIRPYNRVRAILRNIDAIFQPSTCEGSKNCPVSATVGGVWWGVFNTPLQLGTCDPSKYRCNFPTGYLCSFKKISRFRLRRGRGMGIFDTPLRPNTCDPSKYRCDSSTRHVLPFEKLSCFRPLRGRAVRRIRYAPTTGYVRSFEIPM